MSSVETSAEAYASVEREDPKPGSNIPLHLDIGLTAKLYEVLGNRRGAIVAIDPLNGAFWDSRAPQPMTQIHLLAGLVRLNTRHFNQ